MSNNKELWERIKSEQQAMGPKTVETMVCRDCKYKDTGPNDGVCVKYPQPYGKPIDIAVFNADCEYYEKE